MPTSAEWSIVAATRAHSEIEVSIGRGSVDAARRTVRPDPSLQRTVGEAPPRRSLSVRRGRLPSPRVSRRVRRVAARQAGDHHGRLRVHSDVRRARRRGEPVEPVAALRRGAARRSRGHLHGEPRSLLRGRVGLSLRGRGVHGVLEPADERRAALHHQRLRRQGVHHLEVQGRPGGRDRRRHARRRRAADARRRRSTATSRTRTPSPRSRPSRSTKTAIAGHRHALLRRARPGARRASPAVHRTAAGDDARAVSRPCCRCCSARTNDSVYLSPAPFYHAAPLRFSMAAQALGATVVAMEHFDAEQYLALDRAPPRHRHARSCRRCSCAC